MGHFHVGHHMPGYLPDSAPHCVASAEEALIVWREDMRHHIDSLEGDGDFLDVDTAQNLVTAVQVETDGAAQTIEDRLYWIEPVPFTPGDDCDAYV